MLEQDTVPGMAHIVELGSPAPRAGHGQIHVVGKRAKLIDVTVQFMREPPWMAGRLGHWAAVEVGVGIEPGSEGLIDGLHEGDGFASGVLGRADRRNGVIEVAVARGAVADNQVGGGESYVLPNHHLGVIKVEDQPTHETGPIDLHVGVANGVFPGPHAGRPSCRQSNAAGMALLSAHD